jgi:hypothetical protein
MNALISTMLILISLRSRGLRGPLFSGFTLTWRFREISRSSGLLLLSRVRGKVYFEAYLSPALESLTRLLEDLKDLI